MRYLVIFLVLIFFIFPSFSQSNCNSKEKDVKEAHRLFGRMQANFNRRSDESDNAEKNYKNAYESLRGTARSLIFINRPKDSYEEVKKMNAACSQFSSSFSLWDELYKIYEQYQDELEKYRAQLETAKTEYEQCQQQQQ